MRSAVRRSCSRQASLSTRKKARDARSNSAAPPRSSSSPMTATAGSILSATRRAMCFRWSHIWSTPTSRHVASASLRWWDLCCRCPFCNGLHRRHCRKRRLRSTGGRHGDPRDRGRRPGSTCDLSVRCQHRSFARRRTADCSERGQPEACGPRILTLPALLLDGRSADPNGAASHPEDPRHCFASASPLPTFSVSPKRRSMQ